MMKLAYLFPTFPVFHQTFVLWEVMGVRRSGVDLKIYSLRRAGAEQQPEGRQIASEVTYLPAVWSMRVLSANARLLCGSPRRYLRAWGDVFPAWRTGASKEAATSDGPPVALVYRLRGWFYSSPFLYLLKSLLLVPIAVYLAEELRRDGVTHLHAHWTTFPATVAYLASRLTGIPFSISAHAVDIYRVQRMLPAKLQAARLVVTCARANAAFLKQFVDAESASKILVNYHGVDVKRFAPGARVDKSNGRLTIASCGRLELYKGMRLLVDACKELHTHGIDLECSIVGEGPERASLEAQIGRLGLTSRIHLVGARPHDELVELLRRADVFVLASELAGKSRRRDVIANAIVEAMAVGIPVVASHVPGAEELVEDGITGYLVRPNHAGEVAAAIKRLWEDPERREQLGRAARERILRDFDNCKNVRELARWFQMLGNDPHVFLSSRLTSVRSHGECVYAAESKATGRDSFRAADCRVSEAEENEPRDGIPFPSKR